LIERLLILSFLVYPFDGFMLFSVSGYGVKIIDVVLLLLYIFFALELISSKQKIAINNNIVLHFIILLFVSSILSGLYPLFSGNSEAIFQYFKTLVHFIFVYFVVFVFYSHNFSENFWDKLIRTLLIYSIFINIFGIYQLFARLYNLPLAWLPINNVSMVYRGMFEMSDITQISIQFMNLYRATSIFTEPSYYAIFLSSILIFQIVPYIRKQEPFIKNRFMNILILVLTIIALLATFSITAILCVVAFFLGLMIFEYRNFAKKFLVIMITSSVILIITDLIIEYYTETSPIELFYTRIEGIFKTIEGSDRQITGESFKYRTEIIKTGFEIWQKSPITGCGLGNFYLNQNKNINFAHDIFGNSLSEMGLIGAIAILGIFTSIFYFLIKYYKNQDLELTLSQSRLLGVTLFLMIQTVTVNFFSSSFLIYANLWLYVGIALYIINKISSKLFSNNIYLCFYSDRINKFTKFLK
jgi:O-antigen ligase